MTISPARRKPQPPTDAFRPFALAKTIGGRRMSDPGCRLWTDAALLESRSIEMAFESLPSDEVGIDLYVPAIKLDRTKEAAAYHNVRLETGRGGLWITPAFVIALYAGDAIPGHAFLRLSERTGEWIRVQGAPDAVAARLGIRLAAAETTPAPYAGVSVPPPRL